LRIVVKVTKANDALKAVMYSIDQGGPVLPASAFTLQGSTVKMAVAGLAANYAGKLSADGNSIAGTWTQGPNPRLFFRGLGVLPARNATMSDLAGVMQNAVLDRPVIDQAGIAGRYDFTLTWTPIEFQFRGLGARIPPATDSATTPPACSWRFNRGNPRRRWPKFS